MSGVLPRTTLASRAGAVVAPAALESTRAGGGASARDVADPVDWGPAAALVAWWSGGQPAAPFSSSSRTMRSLSCAHGERSRTPVVSGDEATTRGGGGRGREAEGLTSDSSRPKQAAKSGLRSACELREASRSSSGE